MAFALVFGGSAVAAGPDGDSFAFANALAKRKMWTEAAVEYASLTNSADIARDEAVFRLADALRHLSRNAEAKICYERVYREWPASQWSDLARLGAFSLETNFVEKLNNLKSLNRDDVSPDIRQLALFRIGELFEDSGKDSVGVRDAYRRAYLINRDSRTGFIAGLKFAALAVSAGGDCRDAARAAKHIAETAVEPVIRQEALYLGAVANLQTGERETAAKLFLQLHREAPGSERDLAARKPRALALLGAGLYEEAFEAAKELGDNDEAGLYIRIAALSQMSRTVDCRKLCREYLSKYPEGEWAANTAMILVSLAAAEKRHADVVEIASSRRDWPGSMAGAIYGYACDAAIARKDWRIAADFAAKLRKDAQAHAKPSLAARAAYLEGVARKRMDDSAAARLCWTDALEAAPESEWAEKALSARAAEELKDGEALAASRSYEELFRRFPSAGRSPEALYRRGVALMAAKDNAGAESVFRMLLASAAGEGDSTLDLDLVREAKMRLAIILQDAGKTAEASPFLLEIIGTSTEEAIPAGALVAQAQADLEAGRIDAALQIAKAAARRAAAADETILQAANYVLGEAHFAKGERDAAKAAWRAAAQSSVKTVFKVQSSLSLGRLESEGGDFDAAETTLLDTIALAADESLVNLRMDSYAELAANERRRGNAKAELRYLMIVITLFNHAETVPAAIDRAVEILRSQGRMEEAGQLLAEKEARYGR